MSARAAGGRADRRTARGAHRPSPGDPLLSCRTCSFHTNDAPRSLASVVLATRQPSFSGPKRFSTGTSTASRKTSLNSLSPVSCRSGRTSTPVAIIGIASIDIPLCAASFGSVRTRAMPQSAKRAYDDQHLLPGYEIDVAALLRPCREAGEVAPGIGLAEQLAPDVVARQLLVVDGDLRRRRAPPAVFNGPVDADPSSGVERPLPLPEQFGVLERRRDIDVGRRVLPQPGAQLLAELHGCRHGRPADQETVLSWVNSSMP